MRARLSDVIPSPHLASRSREQGPHLQAVNRPGDCASRLRLLPSGDGWALVGDDGRMAFSAQGVSGRRRCLEFARSQGVITLSR